MSVERAMPYTIELTRDEYRSAQIMNDRGYLGCIIDHATIIDDDRPDGVIVLRFTESAAWDVQTTCDEDPSAVWALTTPSTSLGEKFSRFLERIV